VTRPPWRPTREQLAAAVGTTVPDLIAPGLRLLFCGINPGLYSGAVGHHFARPGNRFWRVLHESGLTERLISPFEERELLRLGIGVTNLVGRATATAAELAPAELREGAERLADVAERYRPAVIAVLGMDAYRTAFQRPKARMGPQAGDIGGSRAWLLPNPSGAQASYGLPALVEAFAALRADLAELSRPGAAGRG
jgi:TDG/mug DNA glycosylase family protein